MEHLTWILVCAAILVLAITREVRSRRAVVRLERELATAQAQERVVATFLGCSDVSDALGVTRFTIATRRMEPGGDRLAIEIDEDAPALAREDNTAWSADLAACHRVMEAHGGSVAVERTNGGVHVRLELPTAAGATASG